jgi:formylglycine-generating enzyme required for sulfatase activity
MATSKRGRRIALLTGAALVALLGVVLWMNWEELRTWYLIWRDFESLGKNAQGYPEYRHRETGIIFVKLPGGTFVMGSPTDETERRWDELRHEVPLSPFLIAKHELKQAQWTRVMGSNPSHFEGENRPVENVSWQDCEDFCELTGLSLPSEAQWEYACRAGATGAFCFGEDRSILGDYAWYKKNARDRSNPVGEKKPNAFGLHDVHGNVWEMCEDVWDPECYSKPGARKPDPVCTSGSDFRVMRGGCWHYDAWSCRSAFRYGLGPTTRSDRVGLRLCYPLR